MKTELSDLIHTKINLKGEIAATDSEIDRLKRKIEYLRDKIICRMVEQNIAGRHSFTYADKRYLAGERRRILTTPPNEAEQRFLELINP